MEAPRGQAVDVKILAATAVALLVLLFVGTASSRAAVYPAGGSAFNGGPEGWIVTESSCDVPLLCTTSGGYDGANGDPSGSLSAQTNIALNLLSLLHSRVTFQSPDFTVAHAEPATLHLDRAFAPGALIDLQPHLSYTVTLVDRTTGARTVLLKEAISAASPFTGKDAAATVAAGHTYTLQIAASTSSTVVGTGLLSGATSARFDNVGLAVGSSEGGGGARGGGGGGGAGEGGGGNGALTNARLLNLIQGSLPSKGALRANKVFVKLRCPSAVGRACRITAQGLLSKRKPATAKRTVRVAKGKSRRVALPLKPKARRQVASRHKLLFRIKVKAGKANATAYRRLTLIHAPR